MFQITENEINQQHLSDLVSRPQAGAISLFVGITRDNQSGRSVEFLEYEAYQPMAIKMLEEIAGEAHKKWKLEAIAIHHRIGRVKIQEASVVIAVSSAHRLEAIEACHYLIDRLKEVVPIWKKEFFSDKSSQWLANRPRQ